MEAIKEDFDFEDNSLRPSKTYGTRWIGHRLRAIHKLYDKFKLFALNFENLITASNNNKDRAVLEGTCQKLVSSSIIMNVSVFLDILGPIRDLSLILQDNSLSIVDIAEKINVCLNIYESLGKNSKKITAFY